MRTSSRYRGTGGQYGGFHIAPDLFDGIELRSISRQAFDVEPVALGGQPRGHRLGSVGHEPVPDHDCLLAGEMGAQFGEELDELVGVVGAVGHGEDERAATAVVSIGQDSGHRHAFERRIGDGRTGVTPFGAQVARTTGTSDTPLSSWKQIHAPRRRAIFLSAATRSRAKRRWRPRRVRLPDVRDASGSSPAGSAGSSRSGWVRRSRR